MAKVIIHGCGGAGVSICAKQIQELEKASHLDVEVRYVDASRADFDNYDLDESKFFLIKNSKVDRSIDGSGGVRSTNDVHITAGVEEYVKNLKFERDDIHIIISSASGGSGSLISPRLANVLKQMKSPVVVVTLADYSSAKYTTTTLATLKHLDLMGVKSKYSIPTMIVVNDKSVTEVDLIVKSKVELLTMLLSSKHKALDTTDIIMFINNDYVSSEDYNGLFYLSIHKDDNFSDLKDSYITSLRILTDDDTFKLNTAEFTNKPNQYKIGYVNDEVVRVLEDRKMAVDGKMKSALYFALTVEGADAFLDKAMSESASLKGVAVKKASKFDMVDDLEGVSI